MPPAACWCLCCACSLQGAGFGLLRGGVVLLVLALLVNLTPLKEQKAWRESVGAHGLGQGLHLVKGVVPAHMAQYFP